MPKHWLLPLLIPALLLGGCVAEMAGVGELGAAAELGEAAGAAGALEGAGAIEGAAGLEGSAEGLIESAEARGISFRAGALRPALAELRSSGAPLSIDMAGEIRQAGRYLATLESDGSIVVERGAGQRFLVGKIGESRIWQLTRGGGFEPVGELRGFVPGRGIRLQASPGPFSDAVEILRPNVTAEVVGYQDGWFKVRLLNGKEGFLWSPFVALAMVLGDSREHRSGFGNASWRAQGCTVLTTGRLIYSEVMDNNEGAVAFAPDERGERLIVDRGLCVNEGSDSDLSAWDWSGRTSQAVLSNGALLFVKSHQVENDAVVLELPNGERVISDPSLVKKFVDPEGVVPQEGNIPGSTLPATEERPDQPATENPASGDQESGDVLGATPDSLHDEPSDPSRSAERGSWVPMRRWIRYVNRQRIVLVYSSEDQAVVEEIRDRLEKLGGNVTLERRSSISQSPGRFLYPENLPELADAISEAISDVRPLRLESQQSGEPAVIWLR